jgi:DNA modification methylase
MVIANRREVDAFVHPRIVIRDVKTLRSASRNARTHSKKQIGQLADSIRAFGFINPVLVDDANCIVAGHGRVEAARKLGIAVVPVICLAHLSQAELRAYAIADNRLAELAGWDKTALAREFADLIKLDVDLDVSVTGFDHGEIDLVLQAEPGQSDPGDDLPRLKSGKAITKPGDLWCLGEHRILCGDVRDRNAVRRLMGREKAKMVFTDPPYNVAIAGHASGLGQAQHQDFSCASGEMTKPEFAEFLETALGNLASVSTDGSLHYVCMDWRHLQELTTAGELVYSELKNVCVWNKTNGGMGSMYRSKHELVFVYKSGRGAHVNNVELGRFGRYRSNVWDYAGVNTWRSGRDKDLSDHPTVKPILLVADAIQDASNRGDVVLDGFGGAGTTLIAAERLGRRARLIELEPRYVDVTIERWQTATGQSAKLLNSEDCPTSKEGRKRAGAKGSAGA